MELCVLEVLWRVLSTAVFCPHYSALVVESEHHSSTCGMTLGKWSITVHFRLESVTFHKWFRLMCCSSDLRIPIFAFCFRVSTSVTFGLCYLIVLILKISIVNWLWIFFNYFIKPLVNYIGSYICRQIFWFAQLKLVENNLLCYFLVPYSYFSLCVVCGQRITFEVVNTLTKITFLQELAFGYLLREAYMSVLVSQKQNIS